MIIISHRGNLKGRDPDSENKPEYIEKALGEGFQVEIDLWVKDKKLFLGHDSPDYQIDLNFLIANQKKLWVHCKNLEAVNFLRGTGSNWFWHNKDKLTLTSKGIPWCLPGVFINQGITVVTDYKKIKNKNILGVCTDNPIRWQEEA